MVGVLLMALLAACSSPPPKPATPPAATAPTAPPPVVISPPPSKGPLLRSQAPTPRDYRRDAATHLYARNTERIWAGKLPPLLYAVGVLQVDIDRMGQVTDIRWMRAPTQAPEVMAEIERTVRMAAPFPAPVRMGKVTYTDTWLWHKSGRFQLDTLTEGQL
ncbi:hypothetical protein [uncultured Rhodoferax sp.]|uniref:hypothetical protein n=1 Tax=uncultured Rhodoferax sp. TaxID=223188 RepID=UPI0025F7FAFE|nr:hypothetical protein [uncultured Rhodoferax sp.]